MSIGRNSRGQHAAGSGGLQHIGVRLAPQHVHGRHAQQNQWLRWFIVIDVLLALIVVAFLVSGSCQRSEEAPRAVEQEIVSESAESPAEPQSAALTAKQQQAMAGLSGLLENGKAISTARKEGIVTANPGFTKNQVPVYQEPLLPSGCEIASLTAALNSMGFNVDMTTIVDDYLYVDGDFRYGYVASPYEDNGGGFPPAIVQAANGYLKDQNSPARACDLTGSSFESLCALVESGYPVLVWTTLYLTGPVYDDGNGNRAEALEYYEMYGAGDGESELAFYGADGSYVGQPGDWYINEHCVALYGVGDGSVTVMDPLAGMTVEDYDLFKSIYEQCGSYAAYVR